MGRNGQGFRLFRNVKDGSVLIEVPAGTFAMGCDDVPAAAPRHGVRLPAFLIGRDEITNAQFARFVAVTGYPAKGRWLDYFEPGRERYPVVHVMWADARAYCAWAGLRLPTEAEWERAARGVDGRRYPWGNAWDASRCNSLALQDPKLLARMLVMDRRRGTLPVGTFAKGASACGALDMLGNALEWCASGWQSYPWSARDGRGDDTVHGLRVLRGGSWCSAQRDLAGWQRDKAPADYLYFFQYAGFRVASDR